MKIILNIGLGAPRYDENHMSYTRRLKNAFSWISENFRTCYLEHIGHIGREPTLVVEGLLLDADPEDVHERLHELSVTINQDCVAAFYGETGHLIGPYAHKWQPFDPAQFTVPTRRCL